jgi:hypothetical protein
MPGAEHRRACTRCWRLAITARDLMPSRTLGSYGQYRSLYLNVKVHVHRVSLHFPFSDRRRQRPRICLGTFCLIMLAYQKTTAHETLLASYQKCVLQRGWSCCPLETFVTIGLPLIVSTRRAPGAEADVDHIQFPGAPC